MDIPEVENAVFRTEIEFDDVAKETGLLKKLIGRLRKTEG